MRVNRRPSQVVIGLVDAVMIASGPIAGGSNTTASVSPVVAEAARTACSELIHLAVADARSPLHRLREDRIVPAGRSFGAQFSPLINPLGARGMGEITITGVAAAVANAVFHATGRRVRDLPITPEKLV